MRPFGQQTNQFLHARRQKANTFAPDVTEKTGTEGEWLYKTVGNITRTVLIDCSFFLSSETECAIKLEIPDLAIPYAEYTFTKVEPEA